MKVLATAVLSMEVLVMGFAVLLASKDHSGTALVIGGIIALFLILSIGMLRMRVGWVLGSLLQLAIIAYGFVVTTAFILGVIFTGLWICAIVVGRKGEATRARLLANPREAKGA
ncbi:MAG: DUF4233 domain-containing protein [Actinobacteria bacterium]|nr:DUF4233 domain-containing protein [Actinomycetota bacterium]